MNLIKVVMEPKTEEKQPKPDQGEKATKLYEVASCSTPVLDFTGNLMPSRLLACLPRLS